MSHLPLAAFQQFDLLLEVVFFLVMGFLWLVNRISAAVETARRPPPARRPMPPNVPPNVPQGDAPDAAPQQAQGQAAARPRPPVQQAPARAGSESLQNEIEEFLRRAANRGNPQPAGQQQRPRMPSPRPAVTGAKGDRAAYAGCRLSFVPNRSPRRFRPNRAIRPRPSPSTSNNSSTRASLPSALRCSARSTRKKNSSIGTFKKRLLTSSAISSRVRWPMGENRRPRLRLSLMLLLT